MRPPPDLPPVDYIVLWQPYQPSPRLPRWWPYLARLLKPGFAHVLVAFADPAAAVWTVVNPLYGGLQVHSRPLTLTCAELLADYPSTTRAVLLGRRRDTFPRRTRLGLTCVSTVAAILGLERTPLTPWGLYRHIRALERSEAGELRPDRRAKGRREGRPAAAVGAGGARR